MPLVLPVLFLQDCLPHPGHEMGMVLTELT